MNALPRSPNAAGRAMMAGLLARSAGKRRRPTVYDIRRHLQGGRYCHDPEADGVNVAGRFSREESGAVP